jgi:hypothetical protein
MKVDSPNTRPSEAKAMLKCNILTAIPWRGGGDFWSVEQKKRRSSWHALTEGE